MKNTFRILVVILIPLIADSIGIVLSYCFENYSLRMNLVSISAFVSGYLVHKWWSDKKEGAE
ncbi:hypothetical protein DZB72_15135 [Bacillus sp. MT]|nr:hypothetical protein EQI87_03510 [Bacillus subtilis]RFB02730.1 hypothetical protein DZB72_15135 [Bacillus sp. MT]